MPDSKKLFFIPIIAKALESEDPVKAIKDAFDEIRNLGKLPEYKDGFDQFLEFINFTAMLSIDDLISEDLDGNDEQKETLISALKSRPEWKAEFDRINKMAQNLYLFDHEIGVEILREDQVIGSFLVSEMSATFCHISPGNYTIRLTNGRVVWKGNLTREDLLWAFAYPGKGLAIAAETETDDQKPTKIESILDGELELSVFAGLESGEIKIRVRKR